VTIKRISNKASRLKVGVGVTEHEHQIQQVFVAVTDLAGGEGIYTVCSSCGITLPVVAVDHKDLNALTEYVREYVDRTGETVSIIGFTKRTHYETFRPSTTGDN
jgi:hypothetical protein